MKRHAALAALPLLLAVAGLAQEGPRVAPLPRAHAHNDYAHPRPLLDALACGFCSVEADINLIDGTLLVAHEPRTTKPERTLEALYLEPLAARAREYGGSVYPTEPGAEPMPFFLMIDIKTDPAATFAALLAALAPYRDMLTTYDADGAHPSAVTVLVCRPDPAQALATSPRLVAIDGNLADLASARRDRRQPRRPRRRSPGRPDPAGQRELARPLPVDRRGADARG